MEDKTIEKITILAKLSAIADLQLKLIEDKEKLQGKLEQIEKDERKSNHH
jgi:hypothetical protein|tara:strand:- start:13 stop:162 length:150 start_codon:yes stop_codon:yes gene_type:complete